MEISHNNFWYYEKGFNIDVKLYKMSIVEGNWIICSFWWVRSVFVLVWMKRFIMFYAIIFVTRRWGILLKFWMIVVKTIVVWHIFFLACKFSYFYFRVVFQNLKENNDYDSYFLGDRGVPKERAMPHPGIIYVTKKFTARAGK